jgi:hypothetical protein
MFDDMLRALDVALREDALSHESNEAESIWRQPMVYDGLAKIRPTKSDVRTKMREDLPM